MRYIALLSLCLLACDPSKQPAPKKKLTAADVHEPFIDVKPSVIAATYQENSVAADREFKGRALRIPATVDHVGQDANGVPLVVLRDEVTYDNTRFLTVNCAWGGDMNRVAQLSAGQRFTAKGLGASVAIGAPLVVLCEEMPGTNGPVTFVEAQQDPDWWRKNLDGFIEGKNVENYKVTYLDEKRTQVRIDSDKCDRVQLGVEQIGKMPEGFVVECFALKKGSGAAEWRLPESK